LSVMLEEEKGQERSQYKLQETANKVFGGRARRRRMI